MIAVTIGISALEAPARAHDIMVCAESTPSPTSTPTLVANEEDDWYPVATDTPTVTVPHDTRGRHLL